jgi:hypothetical protein
MTAEETYLSIGQNIEGSVQGQLFGKPCFKAGGKAFICFFQNAMIFKLGGDSHSEALSLDGTHLFDPSGKGRPMKEWVQVPFGYHDKWEKYAHEVWNYVYSK